MMLGEEKYDYYLADLANAVAVFKRLAVVTTKSMASVTTAWLEEICADSDILLIHSLNSSPTPLTPELSANISTNRNCQAQMDRARDLALGSYLALGSFMEKTGFKRLIIFGEIAYKEQRTKQYNGCVPGLAKQLSPFITCNLDLDLSFPGKRIPNAKFFR